jgi:hypothetical protein
MGYHLPRTPEEQQKLNETTFRLILRDFLQCKERDLLPAVPHLEKAVVQWFSYITGLTVKVVDDKPPDF